MRKSISDLLDAYGDPNIELEISMPLSSERIKELTMSKIKAEKKFRKPVTFRVMMAAAIILALAVSVFAASSGAAWFQAYFAEQNKAGLTPEQLTLIEQDSILIDQSQTVDGYTIHVESVMNDERLLYVKLNLYAPEGEVLPYGDYRHFDGTMLYTLDGDLIPCASFFGEHNDEDKTDNHVEILMGFRMEADKDIGFDLSNGGVRLELTNLTKTYGSFFNQKTETMAEGTWCFDLTFGATEENAWEYQVISEPVPCTMEKRMTGEETEIYITSLIIRPLSIDVVYDYPDGADLESLNWLGMKVIKSDGTEIRVMPSDGQFGPAGDTIIGYASFESLAPIVLDEVASIEFPGGTQIRVNIQE